MKSLTLYYRSGSSDKVYQAAIEPSGHQFVVNYAYGRRGTTLQTGTKTSVPVAYPEAERIFELLIQGKQAKGYILAEVGTPYHLTALQPSGILPQLLSPVEETEALDLVASSDWGMQEKLDGRRLLLQKHGDTVRAINRRGLITGLPESLLEAAKAIPDDWLLDGECIGETLHVFDLLHRQTDLRLKPYEERFEGLCRWFPTHPSLQLVELYTDATDKLRALNRLKAAKAEGVVFKRLDAPYAEGRLTTALKLKFTLSASFIVAQVNRQRSVSLALHDSECLHGNVTIPVNQAIPKVGNIVEVRYLYVFPESGCLFQPVYLGERTDLAREDCTFDQLTFKAS